MITMNNIDDQSLSNCQEASRVISQFVIKERFFWIRVIQKNYENLSEFKRYWTLIIHQTSAGILKQFAIALNQFFKKRQCLYADQWSPFHIVADSGLISLCAHVYGKGDIHRFREKNPENSNGATALHVAAEKGHLEIYQFIMGKVKDKNPASITHR